MLLCVMLVYGEPQGRLVIPTESPSLNKVLTYFQREIKIKGQRLEEVENFKYLGAILLQRRIKTQDSFQDSPDNSSSF